MTINRRQFLKNTAGLGLAGLGSSVLSFGQPAFAADTSDYKALVCVFLFGGMDSHDVILPDGKL